MDNAVGHFLTNTDTLLWVLSVAAGLVSLLLTTKIGTEVAGWWAAQKKARYGTALELLEAGVVYVFQTLYREVKTDADKKLTAEDAARLRKAAIQAAVEFSIQRYGKDIVTGTIGNELLDSAVESVVNVIKARLNQPS